MSHKIVLTPQELEEIKDDVRWREGVYLKLKALKGIPNKVLYLSIHVGFQWFFIAAIITAAITKVMKVW